MSFSFWPLNLKGMLRLLSGESRCCEAWLEAWRGVVVGARRTYHVQ